MKKVIKAYTEKFGLIKSIPIRNEEHMIEALQDLAVFTDIRKAYMTDGKTSTEIKFIIKNKKHRPIYYTRSDGERTYGLSIHPFNYPMIAHFTDGTTKVISL